MVVIRPFVLGGGAPGSSTGLELKRRDGGPRLRACCEQCGVDSSNNLCRRQWMRGD